MRYLLGKYRPEVRQYYVNVIGVGGSVGIPTLQALNSFIGVLQGPYGVWDSIAELYPLCGDKVISASVKLKYSSNPVMTGNGGITEDTYTETGLTGGFTPNGSTQYYDTNFSGSLMGDTGHLCVSEYQQTSAAANNCSLGVRASGGVELSLWTTAGTLDRTGQYGSGVVLQTSGYTNWTGTYIMNRSALSSAQLYKGFHIKATSGTLETVSPKPTGNFYLGARNNNGTADRFWRTRIMFASIGSSMTTQQQSDYLTSIQDFLNTMGRYI